MPRISPYKPKEALIQFPSLWLPGSPLPSSRGLGRRCCCDGAICGHCVNGAAPTQWEVVIEDLASESDVAVCTEEACLSLNNTYILDYEYDQLDPCIGRPDRSCEIPPSGTVGGACYWQYRIPTEEPWHICNDFGYAVCTYDFLTLELTDTTVAVAMYDCFAESWFRYELALESTLECLTTSNLDIPFDDEHGFFNVIRCGASGSTCTITAL